MTCIAYQGVGFGLVSLLIGAGCSAVVVDHDQPCDTKRYLDDFMLAADDPRDQLDALRGVTDIAGDLSIEGDVDSLAALSCLATVQGDLEFSGFSIDDFEEVRQLRTVEGTLRFQGTQAAAIHGFPRLEHIGHLTLDSMPNLVSFTGMDALTSIVDGVDFFWVPVVQDLSGLATVQEFTGELFGVESASEATWPFSLGEHFDGDILFQAGAPDLEAALATTRTISGSVGLDQGAMALPDFSRLESVGGALTLRSDRDAPLPDLGVLQTIGGGLTLVGLSMPDMQGLRSLQRAGGVSIGSASALQSLDGLQALTELIADPLLLNPSDGGASIGLTGNPLLSDVSALSGITTVQGNGRSLTSLSISDNPLLADLTGTQLVAEHADTASLRQLPALVQFRGWSDVQRLPPLSVEDTGLVSFEGLTFADDAQRTMALEIYDNADLVDVAALAPVAGHQLDTGRWIFVSGNAQLGQCQARALVDAAQNIGFEGDVVLEDLIDDGPC